MPTDSHKHSFASSTISRKGVSDKTGPMKGVPMTFDFSTKGLLRVRHLRFKRLWLAFGLLLISGVTYASIASVPAQVTSLVYNDKLTHVAVYACLMGWFSQIFQHDLTRIIFVILLSAMGIGIEFIQAATPTRNFEVLDMIANTSGVILAWALAYTWVGTILWRVEKFVFGQRSAEAF